MTGASSWARFVLSKVKVTWRALTISRCPFEEYNPDNEWFCSFLCLCIGSLRPYPQLFKHFQLNVENQRTFFHLYGHYYNAIPMRLTRTSEMKNFLRCRLCSRMLPPPHSLHISQISLPPHSMHLLHCCLCPHMHACRGLRTLQVRNKKACAGAGQGAKKWAEGKYGWLLVLLM